MPLGFLDGDGAVLADLVHRVGDDVADFRVPVGGNGGDLRDLLGVRPSLEISCRAGPRGPRKPS